MFWNRIKAGLVAVILLVAAIGQSFALTPQQRVILFSSGCPGPVKLANLCPTVSLNFAANQYWVQGTGWVAPTVLITTTRAQTVTSYAQDAAGNLIPFAANTPRITTNGLLVEESRTNVVLWNRDLTNVAWIASNITAAKDQVGADGTANGASSIISIAGNGTILQSITLASSARFQSVYMKRLVGTGEIDMTMDNGLTWTRVDSTITTTGYIPVTIPTQTLANPTIGFRIVVNGDKVAVDFVQNENGAFKTSPIPVTTTSVTRNADVVTAIGLLNTCLIGSVGSARVQTNSLILTAINTFPSILIAAGANRSYFAVPNSTTQVSTYNGSIALAATLGSGTIAGNLTAAVGWSSTGRSIVANNGTVATDANLTSNSQTWLIGSGNSNNYANGYILRLTAFLSLRLSDVALKVLTQ
jgi:hypothetical protein